ncbi:hypothetical protein [Salipiger sp.]|uniref:hypothetical protein n=2 Tax=Salipiger sp. TaxID=2078585 RepID=UPI003A981018
MKRVAVLAPSEKAGLDPERLDALFVRMGPVAGEDAVCRAMEELAYNLGRADRLHVAGDLENMLSCTQALGRIADEIGMWKLHRVAEDVAQCIQDGDGVAVAATLARMARVGERSLYAVWDLQDLSV